MRVFIGLTKNLTDKVEETISTLRELGITTLEEAKDLLGEKSGEFMRLKLYMNVAQRPEINLWLQHPSTL